MMKAVRCKVVVQNENQVARTFSCWLSNGKDTPLTQEEAKDILLSNEYVTKDELSNVTLSFKESQQQSIKSNIQK